MRGWKKLTAAVIGSLFLASSTCYAGTIYACKKKIGGTIRIVGAATKCLATETKISWPDKAAFNALAACAPNTLKVGPLCVDMYEASVWSNRDGTGTQYGTTSDDYPATFPDNGNWTAPLYAVSMPGVKPATHITWFQAQQACALSGKRLLTNAEWQTAAAGTPDNDAVKCNIFNGISVDTGSMAACISGWGVHDMVGNAWEWVADWIPGDTNPWNPTTIYAGPNFGDDYMYHTNLASSQRTSGDNLPSALIKGGGWGAQNGAGVFATIFSYSPAMTALDIGFRCGY
jgi:formylglycine-generating enzyme required for sulfatase activity